MKSNPNSSGRCEVSSSSEILGESSFLGGGELTPGRW